MIAQRSAKNAAREGRVVFENVSKFYGEVLGVNRVNLSIPPGITGLVGPNGSGKTTLMNLMTGLIRPTPGPDLACWASRRTTPRSCSGWSATPRSSTPSRRG